ncbi:MAG TPA: four-carbon acid sugar kinase family protein [Burkholderiales bacterium]
MGTIPRVLIVADDLTGAMDSAGPFAAAGAETWVVAAPMQCDPASLRSAAVVSVNTDTRHLTAAQAAARIRETVRYLGTGDFQVIIKKIDSTLRGNVVAETLALLEATGRAGAVVAPAFPAQGRTVSAGVVYVNGTPLARTGFAKDALSPPPLEPLHRAFAQATGGIQADAVPASAAFEGKRDRIWVVDSAVDADLSRMVDTIRPRLGTLLLAGSAGLTQALARACFPAPKAPAGVGKVKGTIVFAVGSRAVQSAEQVEALAGDPETRVLRAPNGCLQDGDMPAARNLVLKATTDDDGREGNAEQVAADMARHAIDVARRTRAEALVATGGDTAIAILSASGNPALQVLGDLMPGIPYARIRLNGSALWLVTKAGGFGGRETFRELVHKLRGNA